ncbi:MAG: D-aminoacyl-tRNA deacylase, partial [Methanomassiliicoccales archaeon]
MLLLVASTEDVAGTNIRDRLLELVAWEGRGSFLDHPVYSRGDLLLATIDKIHLRADDIDREFEEAMSFQVDEVIFLSRHKAASGTPTLTVHPIGNYGIAEHGGRDGTLVPCSPASMAALLRSLRTTAMGLPFNISFEVTHHGPTDLVHPSFFV